MRKRSFFAAASSVMLQGIAFFAVLVLLFSQSGAAALAQAGAPGFGPQRPQAPPAGSRGEMTSIAIAPLTPHISEPLFHWNYLPWVLASTQAPYSCSITAVSPKATDILPASTDFDGIWVIKNTGTMTWLAAETDVRFSSGTQFDKYGDVVDLAANVAPGESYTVLVDMFTPSIGGTYAGNWAIITGKITICTLPLTIVVV